MPNSLKVMIKKLAHKGRISSAERDELLVKLEGHDLKIRADERAKVIHEQRALDVNLQSSAEEVRADERRKFAIWLDTNGYMRKMDLNISRVEEALYEYEKEHT